MATKAKTEKPAGNGKKEEQKPPSTNYCPIHGRLLRANGTCPLKKCAYHTKPVEG